MKERPGGKSGARRRLRWGIAACLVAAGVAAPFGLRLIGQGLPPIIDVLFSREKIDSLGAALDDPALRAALAAELAVGPLWHVGTTGGPETFEHSFWFAGGRRATTRVQGLIVGTAADGGTYRVAGAGWRFASLHLGGKPAIKDAAGLEVLRAAVKDPFIREGLLDFPGASARYESFRVETLGVDRFEISFSADPGGGGSPMVKKWTATGDPALGDLRFSAD